jgi:hypothetical protein
MGMRSRSGFFYGLAGGGILAVAAAIEFCMGRIPISKSGTIRLWVSQTNGPETSQQIADWYSVTHVLHGIILYGLIHLASRRKWPMGVCALLALGAEAGWEVLENSPFIINRYRAETLATGYVGDSILNSMCDIGFCMLGFELARRLPARVTVLLVVAAEVGLAIAIRDNLTLNVLMLIHPVEAIKRWQMGA